MTITISHDRPRGEKEAANWLPSPPGDFRPVMRMYEPEPQMPKWMATIDDTKPVAALGLAAVLSGANPKNLLLAVAGAAAIASTGIPAGQQAIAYLIFAVIGTLGVGIPVVLYFAMGDRSEKLLAGLRTG